MLSRWVEHTAVGGPLKKRQHVPARFNRTGHNIANTGTTEEELDYTVKCSNFTHRAYQSVGQTGHVARLPENMNGVESIPCVAAVPAAKRRAVHVTCFMLDY